MIKPNEGLGNVVEAYLTRFYRECDDIDAENDVYARVVGETERRLLMTTLRAVRGNRLRASKILGINRNTFLRKLRALGLDEAAEAKKESKRK